MQNRNVIWNSILTVTTNLFFIYFIFQQTVCGFDILRTPGTSYVCDVNGFSFVKTSKKYYDDCAQVLTSIILQELAPQLYTPYHLVANEELIPATTLEGTMMELRCVIGVIRHGDRTPKQKMKMEVRHPRWDILKEVCFTFLFTGGVIVLCSFNSVSDSLSYLRSTVDLMKRSWSWRGPSNFRKFSTSPVISW